MRFYALCTNPLSTFKDPIVCVPESTYTINIWLCCLPNVEIINYSDLYNIFFTISNLWGIMNKCTMHMWPIWQPIEKKARYLIHHPWIRGDYSKHVSITTSYANIKNVSVSNLISASFHCINFIMSKVYVNTYISAQFIITPTIKQYTQIKSFHCFPQVSSIGLSSLSIWDHFPYSVWNSCQRAVMFNTAYCLKSYSSTLSSWIFIYNGFWATTSQRSMLHANLAL